MAARGMVKVDRHDLLATAKAVVRSRDVSVDRRPSSVSINLFVKHRQSGKEKALAGNYQAADSGSNQDSSRTVEPKEERQSGAIDARRKSETDCVNNNLVSRESLGQ